MNNERLTEQDKTTLKELREKAAKEVRNKRLKKTINLHFHNDSLDKLRRIAFEKRINLTLLLNEIFNEYLTNSKK